jgi:hypothetical protein
MHRRPTPLEEHLQRLQVGGRRRLQHPDSERLGDGRVRAVEHGIGARPFGPAGAAARELDTEARQLAGRRALFRMVLDGEPDGDPEAGWRYDCRGEGAYRSLWLPDGDDLAAYAASRDSKLLLVEGWLQRIVHPPAAGADGSWLPALVEYRLTGARVVDRPER